MMLYLMTTPPELHEGTYTCRQVSNDQAEELIIRAHEAGKLKSFFKHGSTRHVIKQLCGVKVDVAQEISAPVPREGDTFLHLRVVDRPETGRPALEHTVFFKIEFAESR